MISDSREKSFLHVDASGAEDSIGGRLHLPTLCHPARRWHAHGVIGIKRPWISCYGSNVGDNRESASDGSGTVSGGGGGGGGNTLAIIESPLVSAATAKALSAVATALVAVVAATAVVSATAV